MVSPRQSEVRPKLVTQFTLSTGRDQWSLYSDTATLSNGLLGVDHVSKQTPASLPSIAQLISTGPLPSPQNTVANYPIAVGDDGSWWWKYAVHIQRFTYDPGTHWDFTDQTGDTYGLTVIGHIDPFKIPVPRYWHKVSYNSQQPDIVKIYFGI